jgi:hypothetical protein
MYILSISYHYADQIKENKVGGACGTHGRGMHKVLLRKPKGKRLLGRPRRRWED